MGSGDETTWRQPLSVLAIGAALGLTLTACSSDGGADADPSETVTGTAEPTNNEPSATWAYPEVVDI